MTEEEKSPSLLEQVKAERELLDKARAEAKAEADRLEKIRADQLLSGTAGIRPAMPEPKPETPKEYRKRIEAELKAGKYD